MNRPLQGVAFTAVCAMVAGCATTRMSSLPDEPDDACVALQTLGLEEIMERARARGLVRKIRAGTESGSLPLLPGRAYAQSADFARLAGGVWVLTDKANDAGIPPAYGVIAAGCTMTLIALWYVVHDSGPRPSLPKNRGPETSPWKQSQDTPAPEPSPRPDRTFDPVPPVPGSPRKERPECVPVPTPHRGGDPRHDRCADLVPPNEFPGHDVLVGGKHFDAKTRGKKILWEIKAEETSTWRMPEWLKDDVIRDEAEKIEREQQIAESCGYLFIVGVVDAEHKDAIEKRAPRVDIRKVTCP